MKKIVLILGLFCAANLAAQQTSADIDYAPLKTDEPVSDAVYNSPEMRDYRRNVARGTLGTYNRPPRHRDQTVNIEQLMEELTDLKVNTYHWLISKVSEPDFESLKKFLPLAQKKGIKVWVTVIAPSLARRYDGYSICYERWARDIATLSLKYPCLVAWSIDDFGHNTQFYSNSYMKLMIPAGLKINPKLAFVPCIYYKQSTPEFVKQYQPWIDGVLFPFRNESGTADLSTWSSCADEIAEMKKRYGPEIPIVLDVYASAHSRLGASTPEYVDEVFAAGLEHADGVHIYCHQDPNRYPEKYAILKKRFAQGMKK